MALRQVQSWQFPLLPSKLSGRKLNKKATFIVINGTHIALFGGRQASGQTNTLHIYEIPTNRWIFVEPTERAPVLIASYSLAAGKWVDTESEKLPVGTNSLAAITSVQSQAVNACLAMELADTYLFEPVTKPLVFVYGGIQEGYGTTDAFYLSEPNIEVPPRYRMRAKKVSNYSAPQIPFSRRPIGSLNLALVTVLIALAAIGSVATVASMIGLVVYKRNPVVASASPTFEVLTTLGILLGNFSVFTHVNMGATNQSEPTENSSSRGVHFPGLAEPDRAIRAKWGQ
ncbi:hypothetical protein PhCBS80983_g05438 [Powellomyces hirtus]|uniref:Uncharacterized protein n=1 Tax=Powellomyces hirtus TaxID=109895 RepID=A0A507DWQ0_9FUNG|nr:hypothetical protein PhCBS80983_g05438 [Powellomyces hirtus]